MADFEYLEHTADIKIKASGKDIAEAFSQFGLGVSNLIVNAEKVRNKKNKTIKLSAKKYENLLYDFIEQLLFLFDSEGFIMGKIEELNIVKTDNGLELSAEISGDITFDNNYEIKTGVKAMTYNEMQIIISENGSVIYGVVDL